MLTYLCAALQDANSASKSASNPVSLGPGYYQLHPLPSLAEFDTSVRSASYLPMPVSPPGVHGGSSCLVQALHNYASLALSVPAQTPADSVGAGVRLSKRRPT